jgi:hypothetical protein
LNSIKNQVTLVGQPILEDGGETNSMIVLLDSAVADSLGVHVSEDHVMDKYSPGRDLQFTIKVRTFVCVIVLSLLRFEELRHGSCT